jgi:putative transcriptional regulator
MIIFRIRELIEAKAAREGRKITMQNVSDETGVNRTSLAKMANPKYRHSTTTATIEILCDYFECDLAELMLYISDKTTDSKAN